MQSNWPTTGVGAAVVGLVVGGVVVDGVVVGVVEDVVVDDVEVDEDVVDDVGSAVVAASGAEVLDVGSGTAVSTTESLGGVAESVRVVHPAAARPTVSNMDVTIAGR